MNKEELELLDYVFNLAYSECMSDEIFEIIKLKEKILNIEERIPTYAVKSENEYIYINNYTSVSLGTAGSGDGVRSSP